MGAAGCENDQADSEHTVSLLDSLPEVERVRMTQLIDRTYRHSYRSDRIMSAIDVVTKGILAA